MCCTSPEGRKDTPSSSRWWFFLLLFLFFYLPQHTHIHTFNFLISLLSPTFHSLSLLTSLAITCSCSISSEKSGLSVGSFSHNLSISSLIFGCVFFGIVGRSPWTTDPHNYVLALQAINSFYTKKRKRFTFWTTPTAACNGVMYSYGICHHIKPNDLVSLTLRWYFNCQMRKDLYKPNTLPVNNSHSTIP